VSYITNQWVKMNPFEAAARLNELERQNAALLLEVQDLELQNNAMRSTSRGKEVAKNKKLERENAALRKIADDAIMLIEHANPDAWNNGNTHPDGFGPDEGAVMASRFYSSLLDTRAAIDAARKEAQP
jgi:hypothetical protein